jgi:hypothetical protein
MPGFDIFNFLLTRDQVDDIPYLDVDINFTITFKLHICLPGPAGDDQRIVGR